MISFVGAGPGSADLITLRGAQRLAAADIVVWAGSLVPPALLEHCRSGVQVHDSKVMTLDDVCAVFAAHPHARIVRLHSGDPTLYGATGEQIAWCRAHGRSYEIVPGVSSVSAAAAAAGCELTIPGVAQSVVITRVASGTRASMPPQDVLEAHSTTGATLALLLSVGQVDTIPERLLGPGSAYTPETPVVIAHRVAWPDERVIRTTLGRLPDDVRAAGLTATTLFLIGAALDGATEQCSHVYSPAYTTRFRVATAPGEGVGTKIGEGSR